MARKQSACAQAIRSVKAAIEAAVNTSLEYGGQNSAQFLHLAATFDVMADTFRKNGHYDVAGLCGEAALTLVQAWAEVRDH